MRWCRTQMRALKALVDNHWLHHPCRLKRRDFDPKEDSVLSKGGRICWYHLTKDDVKPLWNYLDAIHNFSRPSNSSEIRSWFVLVDLVSNYRKLTDINAPLKLLLSPKACFHWPVDGEFLTVVWGLEDIFFTTWCTDLHIQTDHRPLVKLLGNRTLDEIENRCLVNFKEKTMMCNFEILYVPGCHISHSK